MMNISAFCNYFSEDAKQIMLYDGSRVLVTGKMPVACCLAIILCVEG